MTQISAVKYVKNIDSSRSVHGCRRLECIAERGYWSTAGAITSLTNAIHSLFRDERCQVRLPVMGEFNELTVELRLRVNRFNNQCLKAIRVASKCHQSRRRGGYTFLDIQGGASGEWKIIHLPLIAVVYAVYTQSVANIKLHARQESTLAAMDAANHHQYSVPFSL